MPLGQPSWKNDWNESRDHYLKWWRREGPVLVISGLPSLDPPRERIQAPPPPIDSRMRHTDPV